MDKNWNERNLKFSIVALLLLTKCIRADDTINFQPNEEAVSAAFNFLIGTFIPSALILTFVLFNKHPNYSYIVGHLDDLFLFGVCFLLPLIVGFIQGILNSESSYQTGGILILVGFLLLRITYYVESDKRKVGLLSYLISEIELVGSIKFDKFMEFVNKVENNSVESTFKIKHYTNEKVGFIQGILNSESSYQTGGILILVGFLLLRITYYVESDKRKVGLLSYLISEIELVGSIKFDKFIEFVNKAENNSVESTFKIKHYTNEKGKKANKELELINKYEINGTSIVIEASDGPDKYIFSVEVEFSNNNKGMFHINKKPESPIEFWKTDKMTIEFEINEEKKIRNIKPKDKNKSNEQYDKHNVIGSLKRGSHHHFSLP
ncbi:hypothetical protein F8M41_004720 [Gigaspora margarita]|uniref:Uncharacterized protein n=1 Tax=Gigaspora margarita TaxID=4874 RepID=A0A8H3XAM8_GIGMA|nr:hypothetical protein F8M41_004720 [Gigaspora margarita]